MGPILLKRHERPLTFLRYNREGDLLFSCTKDHNPTLWFFDNGQRLGSYSGHNGVVWSDDVSKDSQRLITGSADQTAKLWDVKTGNETFSFGFDSPTRAVEFSIGEKLVVITTDPFMGLPSTIIARDLADQTSDSVLTIVGPSGRINRVVWRPVSVLVGPSGRINRAIWRPVNRTIISAGEEATVRI